MVVDAKCLERPGSITRGARPINAQGTNGQKRSGDVIGAAIMVTKIATGEIEKPAEIDDRVRTAGAEGEQSRCSADFHCSAFRRARLIAT